MVAPDDVRTILRALNQSDSVIDALCLQADQTAGRRFGVDAFTPADASSGYQVNHRVRESAAQRMRSFEPAVIHGLLQTSGYAQAVLTKVGQLFGPADLRETLERVSERIKRQKILADSDRKFSFIMAERVLRYEVNSPATMIEQIRHLTDVEKFYPNVDILFVEDEVAGAQPPIHPIEILDENFVVVEMLPTMAVFSAQEDVDVFRAFVDSYEALVAPDTLSVLERNRKRYLDKLVKLA